MIGSSGSGKTTLMRAVEELLAANPALALRSTVVRIHANVLGEEAELGHPGEKLLRRLLERAREQLGPKAPVERLLEQASHGLVFVDEVDKIRSQVGGQPNVSGIRAQEALLTLIENEAVPFTLPDWAGGATVNVDSSGLLFVCAGAFEGLYDAVFHRVTVGQGPGGAAGRSPWSTRPAARTRSCSSRCATGCKNEDLFEYGVSPQFLSRFDAVVLLEPSTRTRCCGSSRRRASPASSSPRPTSRASASGSTSRPRPRARIAREAARQPRLGARALKEVVPPGRRARSSSTPTPRAAEDGVVRIDLARVKEALARDRRSGSASTTSGWDQSFSG